MAWTAPRTWTLGETVTAALLNAHVRDNLLETCPATVTTAGDLTFADAANSMGSRLAIGASGTMLVSDGSAPVWRIPAFDNRTGSATGTPRSYVSLGGTSWFNDADQVAVTVITGTDALVLFGAELANNTSGAITYLSFAVTGATTVAASDVRAIFYESGAAADATRMAMFHFSTPLNAGSNTFTLQGKANTGTGTIGSPQLFVLPL